MNEWALLEISNTTGWSMDAFRIGQDKVDTTRRWSGWIADPMFFSSVQAGVNLKRIRLYYNLKYSLWTNGTPYFPSPDIVPELFYYHYREVPIDWESVSVRHTYQDEGVSVIDRTDTPPQEWDLEYTGLNKEEVEIFDAFNDAVRRKSTFIYTDVNGIEHTGVRIKTYERTHDGNKRSINNVRITLIKNP